tara:strand:- start:2739 stop:3113 length:375 start_codon:yes stop_codon:yes gene_type:complete
MFDILLFALILLGVDMIYITNVSNMYKSLIYNIQGKTLKINLFAVILCYITLIFGIYYFIIMKNMSYIDAGILGVFVYGVFELTNMALFSKWTWKSVLIDTIWGGILFTLSYYIYNISKNYLKT